MEVERELTGEVVDGRFRIEAKLGSGGMGTVWRVQHVVSLQRFALKTLAAAAAAEADATQRFLREARAAAALRTRHVVRVTDAQMQYQHAGAPLPFLVMELLEGKNLQELLDARGKLGVGEVMWMVRQLGRALDVAHKQGIVHRDLKPSNVFVARDEDGEPIVKLCDFGIAKLVSHPEDLARTDGLATRTGALLGTPMYLAPELLRGAGAAVPATDQWSLGLIVFRALAGFEYFGQVRGFSDLVLTIANDPLVPPSKRAPALPAAFDGWFARSCARAPGERWADVAAQVAALDVALGRPAPRPIPLSEAAGVGGSDKTQPAPTSAPRARAASKPVSRGRLAWLAGAVAWAVSAIAVLAWLGMRTTTRQAESAPAPPRVATTPSAVQAPVEPPPSVELPPPAAPPPSPPPAIVESAQRPAPVRAEPKPTHAKRRRAAATRPTPAEPARETSAPAPGLPKGAACQRSAECASGRCAAETCL
jgi:eukaryotic-like serine/threonine-protein kinase